MVLGGGDPHVHPAHHLDRSSLYYYIFNVVLESVSMFYLRLFVNIHQWLQCEIHFYLYQVWYVY